VRESAGNARGDGVARVLRVGETHPAYHPLHRRVEEVKQFVAAGYDERSVDIDLVH
jgi:hypothetical protein